MLKHYWIDDLLQIKNSFIKNLLNLIKIKRCTYFKEFIKKMFDDWDEVMFFRWNDLIFKFIKNETWIIIIDESEKIELTLTNEQIDKFHNLIKSKDSYKNNDNDSLINLLFNEIKNWEFTKLNWKKYLVYDIETKNCDISNLSKLNFFMWYVFVSDEDHTQDLKYKYISEKTLSKFVEYMLDFDWYIVWFNNIYFDNFVVINNVWLGEEKLRILNEKSIDLFLFVRNMIWKKIWLNNLASSLIWISKTLSSWAEWTKLIEEYLKLWDTNILNKVKNYCKNDVKMTLWLLLFFLKFKYLNDENSKVDFDEDQFIKNSNLKWNNFDNLKDNIQESMF